MYKYLNIICLILSGTFFSCSGSLSDTMSIKSSLDPEYLQVNSLKITYFPMLEGRSVPIPYESTILNGDVAVSIYKNSSKFSTLVIRFNDVMNINVAGWLGTENYNFLKASKYKDHIPEVINITNAKLELTELTEATKNFVTYIKNINTGGLFLAGTSRINVKFTATTGNKLFDLIFGEFIVSESSGIQKNTAVFSKMPMMWHIYTDITSSPATIDYRLRGNDILQAKIDFKEIGEEVFIYNRNITLDLMDKSATLSKNFDTSTVFNIQYPPIIVSCVDAAGCHVGLDVVPDPVQ